MDVSAQGLALDQIVELLKTLPTESQEGQAVLPSEQQLKNAQNSLQHDLPLTGRGLAGTIDHLKNDIIPALNQSSLSSRYFGFVTGGVNPAALFAESVVSIYDQNTAVHLPNESINTTVEDKALGMLSDLLDLPQDQFEHRIFTTGATASNVQGLILGREYVLQKAAQRLKIEYAGCAEEGVFQPELSKHVAGIKILTAMPHSSLVKAASLAGIGRRNVIDVSLDCDPSRIDVIRLENILRNPTDTSVYIIAISCAEVNAGRFATRKYDDILAIRSLCDENGAWIHVDGAFGIFARALTSPRHATLKMYAEGVELADSITGDAHKLLNVPYDCGFFFSKHLDLAGSVFQNPNAAYLAGPDSQEFVPSPLNIGIENSRRFRAFPVYASLTAYGRKGYEEMLSRQIFLARELADFIFEHPAYQLLPSQGSKQAAIEDIFIIVLFRAVDDKLNTDLKNRINANGKLYVSSTAYNGQPACRIAVSNWKSSQELDADIVKTVLNEVARG